MPTELAKAYVQIIPSAQGIKGKLTEALGGESQSAGTESGKTFASFFSKAALAAGAIKAAQELGKAVSAAVNSYADYEQLTGGIETLFKGSADTVMGYAQNAYKTAGLSANQYMEQVTSFAASLVSSLGGDTERAAQMGDMAISDMADNVNKMGSSMESIQNAYQGFAKQNYTMLDNLKLGYGGTKTEMERLLADAEKLSGVHYEIGNFADMVEAIHVVQEEMGITGTTALEASETISGSMASAKAAWENLVTGIADENADIHRLSVNAAESMVTAFANVAPRVIQTIDGISDALIDLPDVMDEVVDSTEPWAGALQDAADVVSLLTSDLKDITTLAVGTVETLGNIRNTIDGILEGHPILQEIFDAVADSINPLEQIKNTLGYINTALGWIEIGAENTVNGLHRLGLVQDEIDADGFGGSIGGAFGEVEDGAESAAAAMDDASGSARALGKGAEVAADGLSEEEAAARETRTSLIHITEDAIGARLSGEDLRDTYDELSKELEKLRDEGDEVDIMMAEQQLKALELAAIHQELGTELRSIPGAMEGVSGWTWSLSQNLQNLGISAEEFASDVASMRESVVNDFQLLSEGQKSSMEEMGNALTENLATMQQWNTDIVGLWRQAQADGNTEAMAYVRYLATLGPEYASAVHEFTQAGYDELVSQASTWSEIGSLSAQMTAEGVYADAYLMGDAATQMGTDAQGEAEGVTGWMETGSGYATDEAGGMTAAAPELAAAARTAGEGAKTAANGVAGWYSVGRNYASGIASGISGGSYLIRDAAVGAAKAALAAAKASLAIKSPSRVARDQIGLMFDEGIAVGIDKGAGMVSSAAGRIAQAAVDGYGDDQIRINAVAGTMAGSRLAAMPVASDGGYAQVAELLRTWLPRLGNMQVTLDGGATIGALAPGIDSALGTRQSYAGRGIA